jgi:hypothetical protein
MQKAGRRRLNYRRRPGISFETNDGFTGPGIAQSFPREPFDSLGIGLQRFYGGFELPVAILRFRDLGIQAQNLTAHPFVLLDQWKIPNRDPEDPGDAQKENNEARQLAPDAEVHVHCGQLIRLRDEAKAFFRGRAAKIEKSGSHCVGRLT